MHEEASGAGGWVPPLGERKREKERERERERERARARGAPALCGQLGSKGA